MNLFTRMSNGWNIAMNSFKVLKENRQLILFPILSAAALILIVASFIGIVFVSSGGDLDYIDHQNVASHYAVLFAYYVVNYFIMVFFNTALTHCTHLYFSGERPTVAQGLRFALSRVGTILAWAVFAATVGMILRLIQERVGFLGKIVTGLIGVAWAIATFFVVPVIAYENLGPIESFKRSARLMKEKWGESVGATFSFGIVNLLGLFLLAIPSLLLGCFIHPLVGIALFCVGFFVITVIMSATRAIFVSAVYHHINGDPVKHFNEQFAENLFVQK